MNDVRATNTASSALDESCDDAEAEAALCGLAAPLNWMDLSLDDDEDSTRTYRTLYASGTRYAIYYSVWSDKTVGQTGDGTVTLEARLWPDGARHYRRYGELAVARRDCECHEMTGIWAAGDDITDTILGEQTV